MEIPILSSQNKTLLSDFSIPRSSNPLYETLCKYEIPPGQNSEQIERRTSNVQHRTLNIDDATLYRFHSKRTVACDEPFSCELRIERLRVERLPSASSGLEPVESSRIEFRRVDLFHSVFFLIDRIHYSMLDVQCSMFIFFIILYDTSLSFFYDQSGHSRPAAGLNLEPLNA